MGRQLSSRVAVLLATYNGAQFIESQLRSLQENNTPFTVHWLDDHSTDETRALVRATALSLGIELIEWHWGDHLGVPGSFFQLVECVDADIYLFCDQDDIWQPGKIDATVANLLSDVALPTLCFSDPLTFQDDHPGLLKPLAELRGVSVSAGVRESTMFTFNPAAGHTIGFTRRLRDIYISHRDIARRHAFMHDWWMYLIALASGTARILDNIPTTLYRLHRRNAAGVYHRRALLTGQYMVSMWRQSQTSRRWFYRQAQGFVLASATLPQVPRLERILVLARMVAALDRRQSPAAVVRLLRSGALPARERAFWMAATCLWSDAEAWSSKGQ